MTYFSISSIVILFGINTISLALNCFICDSLEDEACLNLKKDDTDSKFYKPCHLLGSASKVCFKFTEENNKFVDRFCGGKKSKDECWKDRKLKYNGTFCQCAEDGCNNGHFVRPTSCLILLVIVLLQYFVMSA